jgi:putative ABC transport system ATP-binding protein
MTLQEAALLETHSVSKVYGEGAGRVVALDDASVRLAAGEVLVLMGPSGSGKTTLLSVMGCILRPSAGHVLVDGRCVSDLREAALPAVRRKYFGFVFQAFNLFRFLTVRENVEMVLRMKGVPAGSLRAEAGVLLERVALRHRMDAYPRDLSGGEKQRTAIARALAGDPIIILADEPTANLDSKTGRDVLELLRQHASEWRKAVAIVSHDPKAQEVADRVVHLEDGRLRQ